MADETGLKVSACHFPPGRGKWNKIEHRMFCRITENWARPTAVEPGGGGEPDRRQDDPQGPEHRFGTHGNEYPIGVKVSDERMTALSLRRDKLHGDWNYMLSPNPKTTN